MWPILAGLETEYGLAVEGRGPEQQVEDSQALVRGYPGERFVGWDYRSESPRSDIRGFQAQKLETDPTDAQFDAGRPAPQDQDTRSDRVLANGARFYNDHGHPEVATPECWSVDELALQDLAGEAAVLSAARAFTQATGARARVYKNNTDYHGASYGTHESYLVPRSLGFERLYRAVVAVLIARTVVCGAGKVGSESGGPCEYQVSQRADFFSEAASVDTLFRRPVFNTRDEPHADRALWARLHVITGDANRIAGATARKVALVKLALWLEGTGEGPEWRVSRPAASFQAVSRDLSGDGRIELERGWTTPLHVLEGLVEAADRRLDPSYPGVSEALRHGREAVRLLQTLGTDPEGFSRSVDWAAKRRLITAFLDEEGRDWTEPSLRSYDLAYHEVDPDDGLFAALVDADLVEVQPSWQDAGQRAGGVFESTRARARSMAVQKFRSSLRGVSWGALTFEVDGSTKSVALPPDCCYPESLGGTQNVAEFIKELENVT